MLCNGELRVHKTQLKTKKEGKKIYMLMRETRNIKNKSSTRRSSSQMMTIKVKLIENLKVANPILWLLLDHSVVQMLLHSCICILRLKNEQIVRTIASERQRQKRQRFSVSFQGRLLLSNN